MFWALERKFYVIDCLPRSNPSGARTLSEQTACIRLILNSGLLRGKTRRFRRPPSRQPHDGNPNGSKFCHVHDFIPVQIVNLAVCNEIEIIPADRSRGGKRGELRAILQYRDSW